MSTWRVNSVKNLALDYGYQESFDFGTTNESPSFNIPQLDALFPAGCWPAAELSEVLCDKYETGLQLLLPLLAEQNAQNRWITLISPPANIDQKLFAFYGIDMSRVLLIHPKSDVNDKITMNKALKNGKSSIVILWTNNLSTRFLAQWRKSVKQGSCTGIIIHENDNSSNSNSIALAVEAKSSEHNISLRYIKAYGVRQLKNKTVQLPKVVIEEITGQQSQCAPAFQLVN